MRTNETASNGKYAWLKLVVMLRPEKWKFKSSAFILHNCRDISCFQMPFKKNRDTLIFKVVANLKTTYFLWYVTIVMNDCIICELY